MVVETEDYDFQQLQRLSTLEYILLGDLRDLLEELPSSQTRHWLEAILDALLETLPQEFEIREHSGMYDEVVELCPRYSSVVCHLMTDHVMLVRRLKDIRRAIKHNVPFSTIAFKLRDELSQWMDQLKVHNREEKELLQLAVNEELGCGD